MSTRSQQNGDWPYWAKSFPFPLAFVLKDAVLDATDDERCVRGIIKVFTVAIQYVALICAGEYARADYLDERLSWHLERLKRPLISDFFVFVNASVSSFSKHSLKPLVSELHGFALEMEQKRVEVPVLVDDRPLVQSLLLRKALVELRNTLAHRTFQPNWTALKGDYLPLLEMFLTSLQWSTRYPLFRLSDENGLTRLMGNNFSTASEAVPAAFNLRCKNRGSTGETNSLFLGNESMSQFLDLYPLMLVAPCDQCQAERSSGLTAETFLFNGDQGKFLVYLGVQHSLNTTRPKPDVDALYDSKKTVSPVIRIGQINPMELSERAKYQANQLLTLNIESRRYLPQVYQRRIEIETALSNFLNSPQMGFFLTGESGIGKTNLLCKMVQTWSGQQPQPQGEQMRNIILFYQGKGLFAQGTLEDRIIRDLFLEGSFVDLINRLAPTGWRIILIVDGINEDEDPSQTLLALCQFVTRYARMFPPKKDGPLFKVVFSFRTALLRKTLRGLGHLSGDETDSLFPLDVFMSHQGDSLAENAAPYQFNIEPMDLKETGALYESYRAFPGILDSVTGKTRRFRPITPFSSLSKRGQEVLAQPWYLRVALETFNGRPLPVSLWAGKLLEAFCQAKIYGRNKKEQESFTDRARFVDEIVRLMRTQRRDSIERGDLAANPKLAYAVMELQLGLSPFLQLIDEGVLMEVVETEVHGRRERKRFLIRFVFESVLEYLLAEDILREANGLSRLAGANIVSLLDEAKDFEPMRGAIEIVLTEAAQRRKFRLLLDSLSRADQWTFSPIVVDVLSALESQGNRNFELLLNAVENTRSEQAQTVLVQASYHFGERRKAAPMLACARRAYNMGPDLLFRLRRSDILDAWTTSIMNMANALRLLGRFEEAEDFYDKAIEIGKSQRGSSPSKQTSQGLAMSFVNRGTLMLESGAPAEALECFRKAEEIYRELPKEYKDVTAQLLMTIMHHGQALVQLGQTSEASECYDEAVSLARAETNRRAGSYGRLATVLMAEGTLLLQLGRHAEAIRDLEEAVRILETQEDDRDANTVELAPLLSHLGMAFAEVGSLSKSLACFDKAIAIHRNSMNSEDVSHMRLARLLMNKGTALDRAGRYGEAADCYDEGVSTWQLAIDRSTTRLNSASPKERLSFAHIMSEEIFNLLKGMTTRFDLFRRSADWPRAAVEIEKLFVLFVEYKTESVAKGLTRFFTELRDMSPLERENLYAALGEKEEIFRGIIESKSISFEFVDEDE